MVNRRRLKTAPGLTFGNSVYSVTFDGKPEVPAPYSERYVFHLEDAIDDLPEFLADYATLAAYVRPPSPRATRNGVRATRNGDVFTDAVPRPRQQARGRARARADSAQGLPRLLLRPLRPGRVLPAARADGRPRRQLPGVQRRRVGGRWYAAFLGRSARAGRGAHGTPSGPRCDFGHAQGSTTSLRSANLLRASARPAPM